MPNGPFDTYADARNDMGRGRVKGTDVLLLACVEAGVQLGRFDVRVLGELGEFDIESVWVVASIIRRAGRCGE